MVYRIVANGAQNVKVPEVGLSSLSSESRFPALGLEDAAGQAGLEDLEWLSTVADGRGAGAAGFTLRCPSPTASAGWLQ